MVLGLGGDSAPNLTHSYISERDVDLLLVEELASSRVFGNLILNTALGARARPFILSSKTALTPRHSVSSASGESDIELHAVLPEHPSRHCLVLIENKLDAPFQPSQAARYRDRAAAFVAIGSARLAATLLIAPQAYLEAVEEASEFDSRMSYEQVQDYFRARAGRASGELARRMSHRFEFVNQAIIRARRGYVAVADGAATAFVGDYWRLAKAEFPHLLMQEPRPRPRQSGWIVFESAIKADPRLPRTTLRHKTGQGIVDLEVKGWGTHVAEVLNLVEVWLLPQMRIRKAGGSLAFSIGVPSVQITSPFVSQDALVREALTAAARLKDWWAEHSNAIVKAASLWSKQGAQDG